MAIFALSSALFLWGCKRDAATGSLGTGSVGTGDYTAWFAIQESKLPVVVWVDSGGESSGSGGSNRVLGFVRMSGGKPIAIGYHADDASVTIDQTRYDLSRGPLFLVYSKETPTRIVQLQRSAPETQDPAKTVTDLSRNDPDVRRFIEQARGPKAGSTTTTADTLPTPR